MPIIVRRVPIKLIVLVIAITGALQYLLALPYHQTFVISENICDTNTNLKRQTEVSKCEVIHIGIVSTGYIPSVNVYHMLKSLLFYRNNPLHFHLLVDEVAENILKTLFETWNIPEVTTTYYNANSALLNVPNTNYSTYELLKQSFPRIISTDITDKLIVLDTDLTFASNIYELWSVFTNFKKKQVIGLTGYTHNNYLELVSSSPRSTDTENLKGFNTDIILYWLEGVKKLTEMGNQNMIKAIVEQNPELVYRVPCQWNVQLIYDINSYNCYNTNPIKIMNWNSTNNNVLNKDEGYFRTIFAECNGHLMQRQLSACTNTSNNIIKVNKKQKNDLCYDFHKAQTQKFRTLLFFRKFEYSATKDDVTFVTQLSYERIQMVEELAKLWNGPISITFYLTDPELQKCINFFENSNALQNRYDIACHAVFKEGEFYPTNVLRNFGIRNVVTPYVFLVDIDFAPMPNLYENIKQYIGETENMQRTALIVPAFEVKKSRKNYPKDKNELLKLIDNKIVFQALKSRAPTGHAPTNYAKWRTAQEPYKIKWQPRFEPYIVVQRDVTEYDPRFVGYGWNKVMHIVELNEQGYDFVVLPNAFIVHQPHPASHDLSVFRKSNKYRMCVNAFMKKFTKELQHKYGITKTTI